MNKFSSINRNSFLVSIPAVFFSMFLIAAISPIGIQDNSYAVAQPPYVTCEQVDDANHGHCTTIYKDSKSGFTDCEYGVNCQPGATVPNEYQTVYVDNDLSSSMKKPKSNKA